MFQKIFKYAFLIFLLPINLSAETNPLYSFQLESIKGNKISLSSFKGRVLLIVNIATQCGYTPQLKALQELNKSYGPKGLVVLGIPSNDFGGQTPEANPEVENFCKDNYGVSFPLTKKLTVSGVRKHALFTLLTKKDGEILWNFEKFLIDKKGNLIKRFRSGQNPLSKDIIKSINKLIN